MAATPAGHPRARDVSVAILAGGSGTRLWPRSRRDHPKQLIPLLGERSLLQETVRRVLPLVPVERIYVLTGPDHAPAIAAQLRDLPRANILIEPSPRGTAPCLGLAAMTLAASAHEGGVMVSLHADHVVRREAAFRDALLVAIDTARRGYLTTIGIVPTRPETGYGYIERREELGRSGDLVAYRVAQFREKPPLEVAEEYARSGRHYWNSGYFAWTYERFLDDLRRHLPRMAAQLAEIAALAGVAASEEEARHLWDEIEPVTIDVGLMERAERVAVVPCDLGWSDVGSWAAIHDLVDADESGNATMGDGEHVALDTESSLVYAGGRLIATVGLRDMIVVDAGDAVLVLPRSRAQDVSRLVQLLRERGLDRYL